MVAHRVAMNARRTVTAEVMSSAWMAIASCPAIQIRTANLGRFAILGSEFLERHLAETETEIG